MLSIDEKNLLRELLIRRIRAHERAVNTGVKGEKDTTRQREELYHCLSIISQLHLETDVQPSDETLQTVVEKPTGLKLKLLEDYRFLIIDDHSFMRTLLKRIFSELGYVNIDTVDSAEKGLTRLNSKNYDAVFCDWDMPGMSGLELLEKVRSSRQFKDLIFVMVSGIHTAPDIRSAIRAGVNGYIVKPVSTESLANSLRKLGGLSESSTPQ